MDRELWTIVMAAVRQATRTIREPGRRPTWPLWLVAAMELWRTWHHQSLSWACDPAHCNHLFRPRKRTRDGRRLPSVSRFSRRVKSEATRAVLQQVDDQLARRGINPGSLRRVDGKPLTISPVGKDPDAKRGHVGGGFAKGYKLHAFINQDRRIACWSVMPLNWAETTVAAAMAPHLPPAPDGMGLTLADANYDSAPFHQTMAAAGDRLFTPLKGRRKVKAGGRHPVTLRQMGPERREAVQVWRDHPDLARHVLKARNEIEGVFSVLTVACGLCLPPFVRRLDRVRRWVGCKIILYHARLLAQERAAA